MLRRNLLILSATILLLIPLIWITHYFSWKNGFERLHTSNQQQLEQFIEHLDSRLARFKFLPQLIAKNQLLVELLNDPASTPRVDLANHFLEEVNAITGASDTYLMDAQGWTLAASNWRSERPFVGINFSFRPYFVSAMQGKTGQYFALGTTSGERGYYFAYPISYAATIIGVIVTKMDLSNIEQRWSSREIKFVVTDPDGIIFITTQPDWLYHSTRPLTRETLQQVALSRRYSDIDIQQIDLQTEQKIDPSSKILKLRSDPGSVFREYLTLHQNMPDAGWSVMILAPLKGVKQQSLLNVSVMILSLMLLLLIGLLGWQRHKRSQERERFQLQAQKQLEHEVSVRTRDLRYEIDEHKQTEQMLRDTQGELIQTAKLAVLGQMSASISHELNNPLAAIRSYADNARQFLTLHKPDKADENLGRIADLTERMAKISSQLKFFARKSSGTLEKVKVQPVIQTAIDIISPQYKNNLTRIRVHNERTDLQAMADIIQLEQILINLINNALQAIESPADGTIDIRTELVGKQLLIHVEDNGPGIQPDNLKKIFDPFFTTKKTGLGLGLSISARILESMNGQLSCINLPTGGARFSISLMAAEQEL